MDETTASPGYALGQLQRALVTAAGHPDRATRQRAGREVERWEAVLDGMTTGTLTIGSRTPVEDTPVWVTLEVAHGGFATGRYLAEQPLDEQESARLQALPDVPGSTDRERLNLWYLSDGGQAELLDALTSERYVIDLPEQAALPTVALLLAHGHAEQALDLVAHLRPLLHRLRLTPRLTPEPCPHGAGLVHLATVQEVRERLLSTTPPQQVRAMQEALRIWNPLYDDLVALWCDTVEGDLPSLQAGRIAGGWPARLLPSDWAERRRDLLDRYAAVREQTREGSRHRHRKSNFQRLVLALERSSPGLEALSGREVGWVRAALAGTLTADGRPGSERRAALRATQAVLAARPTRAAFARVLADRLQALPGEGGLPVVDPVEADVTPDELDDLLGPEPLPENVRRVALRALQGPVEELVERGVLPSAEALARVVPQMTAQHAAEAMDDPVVASLHARTYAAFRRRRSLLLLNLEHQVRLSELPWVAALEPFERPGAASARTARETLDRVVLLALRAFPQTLLPNPLVREIGSLTTRAGLSLPLVEEVAADIFLGTFTTKWRRAAEVASRVLEGTVYAAYYDLPAVQDWQRPPAPPSLLRRLQSRWTPETAEDFAALCRERAVEAGRSSTGWSVAANGTVIEQSQILTSHDLAVLVDGLDLGAHVRELAPAAFERTLDFVLQSWDRLPREPYGRLQTVKNLAYAWRQALFLLSYCSGSEQQAAVGRLGEQLVMPHRSPLRPVAAGLAAILDGQRFDASGRIAAGAGRRLLGWSVGPHWLLDAAPPSGAADRSSGA